MGEPQYQNYVNLPRNRMGLRASVWYDTDPRSLLFSMARYKFVAKMLAGKDQVLEIGCGDAFGTRLVQQEVGHVTAIDFDATFIKDARKRQSKDSKWYVDFFTYDILIQSIWTKGDYGFDAAYAIDVLEHIAPQDEALFMRNICDSLVDTGVLILGTPSKESQAYASEGSKAGHVNLKSGEELRALMLEYCQNVFLFSMSDEVIHTGFSKMAHYLFAIGAGIRDV